MKFESKPQPSTEKGLSKEKLLRSLETMRIPSEEFAAYYSEYRHDMALVENTQMAHREREAGKIAEALILTQFARGKVGELLQVRAANDYDDLFKGVDAVVEQKFGNVPALATIDATINQEDLKGTERRGQPHGENRPIGLDKKLEKAKRHIDTISRYSAERAREVSGWMQSGGLHEKITPLNKDFFIDAEKVMLMKYYLTPKTDTEESRPSYIIGGPKTVISIDTEFINKALQGNKEATAAIQALSIAEFFYNIQAEMVYLQEKVKENPNRNIFFDTYFTKVDAWMRTLEQPAFQNLGNEVAKVIKSNPDAVKQIRYYMQTVDGVFRKKRVGV